MNQHNYNQPDGRDIIAHLIEVLSPMMNAGDESILRSLSANSYISDFRTLIDVLNGKRNTPFIYKKVIENAGEYYKQVNKSLLNFRNLNMMEKARESNEIDLEASRLKSEWRQKLQQKGISII